MPTKENLTIKILVCVLIAVSGLSLADENKTTASYPTARVESFSQHNQSTHVSNDFNYLSLNLHPLPLHTSNNNNNEEAETQKKEHKKEPQPETEVKEAPWDSVVAIAACLTVLIGTGQAIMFWRQLKVMKENTLDTKNASNAAMASAKIAEQSIQLARNEFKTTHRPWIKHDIELSISSPCHSSPIFFDEDRVYATLKFTLSNIGTIPAFDVRPELMLCTGSGAGNYLVNIQREFLERLSSTRNSRYKGPTIFPGQTISISITTNCLISEIEYIPWQESPPEGFTRIASICAIGFVDYQSTISSDYHQTGFCYHICATQGNNGKMSINGNILPIQEDPIPACDLFLSPTHMYGPLFFAN